MVVVAEAVEVCARLGSCLVPSLCLYLAKELEVVVQVLIVFEGMHDVHRGLSVQVAVDLRALQGEAELDLFLENLQREGPNNMHAQILTLTDRTQSGAHQMLHRGKSMECDGRTFIIRVCQDCQSRSARKLTRMHLHSPTGPQSHPRSRPRE